MRDMFAALCAVLMIAVSGPEGRAAPAAPKIVIAHAAVNARVLPLWIAKEQGFFAKYGVPSQTIFIRQAPTLVAALTSGDIQIGYTGGTAVLGADASGADLRILAAFTNRVTYDVVARKGVKRPDDLRGKTFGVQSIGGTVWMGAILALEHFGLDPERDSIHLIAAGDQSTLAQALMVGTIDVTALDGVMSRTLRKNGFPVLAELARFDIPITSVGIVAREGFIRKNPELVEGVLKALLEGEAFLVAPSNKTAVLNILKRYLRVDGQEAQDGYDDALAGLDRKPYVTLAGLKNVQRLMKLHNPKVGKVKVEELIDDGPLKKLDQSGFIDALYEAYSVK